MLQSLQDYWISLPAEQKRGYPTENSKRDIDLFALAIRFKNDLEFRTRVFKKHVFVEGKALHYYHSEEQYDEAESILKLAYFSFLGEKFQESTELTKEQLEAAQEIYKNQTTRGRYRQRDSMTANGKRHDYLILQNVCPDLVTFYPDSDVTFLDVLSHYTSASRGVYEAPGSDEYETSLWKRLTTSEDRETLNLITRDKELPALLTDDIVAVVESQVRKWGPAPTILWACSRILPFTKDTNTILNLLKVFSQIDDYTDTQINLWQKAAERKLHLLDASLQDFPFQKEDVV